jgi:hypothetical protein
MIPWTGSTEPGENYRDRNAFISQAWWYTSVIPAFGRWKQEDHGFLTNLGYTARPCLKTDKKKTLYLK